MEEELGLYMDRHGNRPCPWRMGAWEMSDQPSHPGRRSGAVTQTARPCFPRESTFVHTASP